MHPLGKVTSLLLAGVALAVLPVTPPAAAQQPGGKQPGNTGPYNAHILTGGIGIERALEPGDASVATLVAAGAPYTLATWMRADRAAGEVVLVQLGAGDARRALVLVDGRIGVRDGATLVRGAAVAAGGWHHLAASSDGERVTLFLDGRVVGRGAVRAAAVAPRIAVAPALADTPHFGGDLVDARAIAGATDAAAIAAMVRARPDFALVQMTEVGVGWPLQKQANIGLTTQQDAWTLPRSGDDAHRAPVARPVPRVPVMQPLAEGRWQVNGWMLAAAPL